MTIQLYLGDCLDFIRTMPDKSVDAVVTDPPYNVGKDYGVHNDSMSDEDYRSWYKERIAEALRISNYQFWVAPRYKLEFWMSLLPSSHLIVIPRGAAGPFRGGWTDNFEIALAIGRSLKGAPSDLWRGIRLKGEGYFFREETYGHPGYTPSQIMGRAIEYLTKQGDTVFDPFMGTGTTGVEAIKRGRNFIGCEISEEYFKISEKRIKDAQDQPLLDGFK